MDCEAGYLGFVSSLCPNGDHMGVENPTKLV